MSRIHLSFIVNLNVEARPHRPLYGGSRKVSSVPKGTGPGLPSSNSRIPSFLDYNELPPGASRPASLFGCGTETHGEAHGDLAFPFLYCPSSTTSSFSLGLPTLPFLHLVPSGRG